MNRGRFELITAGHHFLVDALPFRDPETRWALETFVRAAQRSNLPSAEIDAILIRCLAVMNQHADHRLPSLVDRYLNEMSTPIDCLRRFSKCIDDVLRQRGIRDGSVQQAIHIVNSECDRPTLTPLRIAQQLNLRLPTLCVAFKRETGRTLGEEIRQVRLDRAATLLATTSKSIKEVWSQVGYNYPSNFDHDFKHRFLVSPTEYRGLVLRPAARQMRLSSPTSGTKPSRVMKPLEYSRVLIVDDDQSTRETVGAYLEQEGYTVFGAPSGRDGLQAAEAVAPNVVLLDYRLPDMTGIDFLRSLRSKTGKTGPSVALFTADWDVIDRAHEVHALHAMIASKLCDLDLVGELVSSLVESVA